ncbi:MAG TPA: crossover junction endodeoxyribonuclease RuvC, partial [Methylocella sp.]|nr:crossover junction endodeoxyribonuclease RuvC [Methylocella sp.]
MGQGLLRIIGLDPGLRSLGWGVVELDGVELRYVASGAVRSEPTKP